MFLNNSGRVCADAERIIERASHLSVEEIAELEARKGILTDVIHSFEARLADLPKEQREAVQCLLYKDVSDLFFDYRLALESRLAREAVRNSPALNDKLSALSAFKAIMADIAALHGE